MSTKYTFDQDLVSDLHKDARGFRPGEHFWAKWDASSDDDRQKIWDGLISDVADEIARERAQEEQAVAAFEAQITALVKLGAGSRKVAIRWFIDSLGISDYDKIDKGYICYCAGLPYEMASEFDVGAN